MQLLDMLSFVPDEIMVKLQYRIKTGRKLNLKNPQRYTEKLQWYKLYYRDPLMAMCADKYEVRKYVKKLELGSILNECYGVFDRPEDVDFSKLPNQFVLKDTLGGGGNSVIICRDKSKADLDEYRRIMQEWVDTKCVPSGGREWVYYKYHKQHRIIAERFITTSYIGGISDYKVICFNGKANIVVYDCDRFIGHKRNFYSIDWKNLNVDSDCQNCTEAIPLPPNYENMIKIAEKLSKKFPSVRVDLYNLEGKILFGELTFYPWSGYVSYKPDKFDYVLGKRFVLPKKRSI